MPQKRLYARLEKTETQSDGTLKVWGYASSEATDADGEVVTAEAMRAALPDYLKWGAVREMHQAIAAGTAIEATVQDDGRTWFGAHIVDADAVKKIQAQVYKGFSIGGTVTERDPADPTRITGLRLVEISLVDRPANPESIFTMFKADHPETPMRPNTTEPTAAPKLPPEAADSLVALHKVLRACHQTLAAACDKLEELAGPVAKPDTAEPPAPEAPDTPAKAELALALHKLATEHHALRERLARLEAQPAAPGAHLRAFGKHDDRPTQPDLDPILTAQGHIDQAATLIKRVHRAGGKSAIA